MMFSSKRAVICVLGAMLATTMVAEAKTEKIRETFTSPMPGLDSDGNLFEGDGEGEVKIFARINKKGKGHFRASGKGETENLTGERQRIRNSVVVEGFAEEIADDVVDGLSDFDVKRSLLVFKKPDNGMSKIRLVVVGRFTV